MIHVPLSKMSRQSRAVSAPRRWAAVASWRLACSCVIRCVIHLMLCVRVLLGFYKRYIRFDSLSAVFLIIFSQIADE